MSEARAVPEGAPDGWVRLACRPGKAEGHLVFPYEVTNAGPAPVLVMDAWRRQPANDADPVADDQVAQVVLRDDGVAVVGKYVPALADAARPVMPALPLCVLLKPGETLARELRVRLPLAEGSVYCADLLLRGYAPVELRGMVLAIGWWPVAARGLVSAPAPWAPGHQVVTTTGRLPVAGTAQQRFPVTRLEVLKRGDAFARVFPAHPGLVG